MEKIEYRHNLSELLDKLRSKGVPITEECTAVIIVLSEQHKKHQLRYDVLLDNGAKTY